MRMDGVTLVALIAIGAFAIERITRGLLFLLSWSSVWQRRFPDPALASDPVARTLAERKQQLAYYFVAGILGLVVVAGLGNVRVLHAVGIEANPWFDAILTGLILVGGADRVAQLLNVPKDGGKVKTAEQPIQISGRLVLEESSSRKAGAAMPGNDQVET